MEYAIHLLALFIALNFLLKVGFYPRWGMWTVAAGYAFFAWLVTPWMTEQSKTVVAAFFASRPQMLNLSVCVTLEAAVMITFCFDCFAEMRTRNTAFKQAVTLFLKLYPGILIGGVICYVLALLLFSFWVIRGSAMMVPSVSQRVQCTGIRLRAELIIFILPSLNYLSLSIIN